LFVSNSQVIGCIDRLRNDLYYVGWGVKLYSTNQMSVLLTNISQFLLIVNSEYVMEDCSTYWV